MSSGSHRKPGTWATSDIGLAAYALMSGMKLMSVLKRGRKAEFRFADAGGMGKEIHVDYLNSEFSDYNAKFRELNQALKDCPNE